MKRFVRLVINAAAALAIVAGSGVAAARIGVEIIPANPRYLETVIVRLKAEVFSGLDFIRAHASMSGNQIVIDYTFGVDNPGVDTYELEIGRFPAGTYTVTAQSPTREPSTVQFTVSGPVDLLASPRNVPVINYSDLWWTPSESGWGLSIIQGPTNVLVAAWFTFDENGNPVWYTLQPGKWTSERSYSGPIYKTTGPYFGASFDASLVRVTPVGSGGVFFRSFNKAEFFYTVDGVTARKVIERFVVD